MHKVLSSKPILWYFKNKGLPIALRVLFKDYKLRNYLFKN